MTKARFGWRDGYGDRSGRSPDDDDDAPRVVVTGGLPEPEKS